MASSSLIVASVQFFISNGIRDGHLKPFNNTFMDDLNNTDFDLTEMSPNSKGKNPYYTPVDVEEDDSFSDESLYRMFGIMFGFFMFFVLALCLLKIYMIYHEKHVHREVTSVYEETDIMHIGRKMKKKTKSLRAKQNNDGASFGSPPSKTIRTPGRKISYQEI